LRPDSTLVQAALRAPRVLALDEEAPIAEEELVWARQHGFAYALALRSGPRPLGLLLLGTSRAGEPDLELLCYLVEEAALAYERALLYETLHDHTLGVVRGLVTLIERTSNQDASSTERVVRYTQALAHEVQFPEESRRDLVYGAVLRDIGMLRIDPTILRSSGQLTAEQWEVVRRHTLEGAQIMRQMRFGEVAVDVVLHHHEAYNGEGYPAGLRGRAIPLGARLVAVAESYVKMTMDRPYRKAISQVEALESLAENWGLRYDPLIVDALVRVVNRELSMGLDGEVDLARDLFGVA
jgi:HD-GYP domain-containing protein (c-di-GMP phosphodiesterase class II)